MTEALVKEIITQILAAPELQALLSGSINRQAAKPGCLIVVDGEEAVFQLKKTENRLRQDYSVSVCVVGGTEAGDSINRISCEQAFSHCWELLHIPVCSAEQLAQIALGLQSDQVSKLAAQAINKGISVTIGRVNWEFTARTPQSYRQLFASYVRQAAAFGVVIEGGSWDLPQPAPEQVPEEVQESGEMVSCQLPQSDRKYDKRLLSDKEALQLPGNSVLRIVKSTVLTPTAIDILKTQRIEVYREGVRCF